MSIYREYIKNFPELDNPALTDVMLEEGVVDAERSSVMRSIRRMRSAMEPIITGEGQKGDKFIFDGENYEFDFGEVEVSLTAEEVEGLFRWYAVNKNTLWVCKRNLYEEFGAQITESLLKRVFKCFGLTKKGPVVPPHVEHYDIEDLDNFQEEMQKLEIDERIASRRETVFKDLYEKEREKTLDFEELISAAVKRIDEAELFVPGPIERVSDPTVDTVLLLSDWHVGMTADIRGNSFNADIFRDRITNLKNEIVTTMSDRINRTRKLHVFLLGDMVDAVLRNMHDSMAYQQDLYGIDQSMLAAMGMVDVIDATHTLLGGDLKVYSIGGNHGRCTPDRNGDRTRVGDQSAYAIAMASLSNRVDDLSWHMEQTTNFIRTEIQGINIMASHGDNTPSNLRAAAWSNMGSEMRDTIFVSGHRHTYSVQQMTNILKIENGSLCGGNQFSIDQVVERSEPSQTMFDIVDGKVKTIHHLFV